MNSVNSNEFVASLVKNIALESDPDVVLTKSLEYICSELRSDRAFIFEESNHDNLHVTYESHSEGLKNELARWQDIPKASLYQKWIENYEDGNLIVEDVEILKDVNPDFYIRLVNTGTKRFICGPLYENDKLIGFYGVSNYPTEYQEKVNKQIGAIQYILALQIRIRNFNRVVEENAEIDSLTKVYNRKALNRLYDGKINTSIGVLLCDLNGLKVKNDEEGHLAGDKYILELVDALDECFGDDCVFRLGGDEFLVVKSGISKESMDELVDGFNAKCQEVDISVAYGYEYNDSCNVTIEAVIQSADSKMYLAKREFYNGAGKDRRNYVLARNDNLNNILFDAFSNSSEYVYMYVFDMNTGISRWSPTAVDYFELPSQYMIGAENIWLGHVHPEDRPRYIKDINAILDGSSNRHACQYRARNKFGKYVWLECNGVVEKAANGGKLFAGMMTRLDSQSNFDSLTGLRTKNQLYNYDFTGEKGYALLIGVDFFKNIITTYGFEGGDEVLALIGKELMTIHEENIRIYRFNGDEFVFLAEGATKKSLQALYDRVQGMLSTVALENGLSLSLSYTGAAVPYKGDADFSLDSLINNLEVTVNFAKAKHRGRLVFYSDEIRAKLLRENVLKKELKDSIANNFKGFELYYQPWLNSATDKIEGCEALLRWKGDTIHDSNPMEFIPILEESDDIIEVGRFVMREAMRQQREWSERFGNFIISFNVSYRQFLEKDYAKELVITAHNLNVDPSSMCIELTESCNVQSQDALCDVFTELRKAGFTIALDDFGTGYSSLELFKTLPCDAVKIEHGFVRELANQGHEVDFAIISTIKRLCDELGKKVVIEGVENSEVEAIVKQLNPRFLQGYNYSKPIDRRAFEEYVDNFNSQGK